MPAIDDELNEAGESLLETFPDRYVESGGSGDTQAARAYNLDPRERPPQEDVNCVEVRNDYEVPWSVQTTAWNESRGMGDLADSDNADMLDDAMDAAEELESQLDDV